MPKNSSPKKAKKGNPRKHLVFFCSCCAAAILLFLSGSNLKYLSYNKVLGAETEIGEQTLSQKISFWEDFLAKSPTYFDGWVELAYLMLSLENKDGAIVAYGKAQAINPNSEKLEDISQLLGY